MDEDGGPLSEGNHSIYKSSKNVPSEILVFHYIKIPHCSLIILFNCLLIMGLKKFTSLKHMRRHYFTFNLAVADLATGCEGILHSMTFFSFLSVTHPLIYFETCVLKCTVYASLLTFLIIAIVECNAVADPLNNNLTRFKCVALISLIWSVSVTLSVSSTYIKATETRTYYHVKEFELTFYLTCSSVICLIYLYILSLIQARKRKFQFYNASGEDGASAAIWATNSASTSSLELERSNSIRRSSFSHRNRSNSLILSANDKKSRLRVSCGTHHFYKSNKAAATAALITFTFMACFIPYIAFYARNLKELVGDTLEMQLKKSYVNGIIFTFRSLLNPFIYFFRSPEIRKCVISSISNVKRNLLRRF